MVCMLQLPCVRFFAFAYILKECALGGNAVCRQVNFFPAKRARSRFNEKDPAFSFFENLEARRGE